jgi:hypothetical protein
MSNETKQTAVELLFLEFKSLSKVSRDAGDEQTANLIDFLCEREQQAKEMEKSILTEARQDGIDLISIGYPVFAEYDANNNEEWYEHTYGGNK